MREILDLQRMILKFPSRACHKQKRKVKGKGKGVAIFLNPPKTSLNPFAD